MALAIILTKVTTVMVDDKVRGDDKEHGKLGEPSCLHIHVHDCSEKTQWKAL